VKRRAADRTGLSQSGEALKDMTLYNLNLIHLKGLDLRETAIWALQGCFPREETPVLLRPLLVWVASHTSGLILTPAHGAISVARHSGAEVGVSPSKIINVTYVEFSKSPNPLIFLYLRVRT
jgi:hypothetical protein